MILNRQSEVGVDLGDARRFAQRLRAALHLGGQEFNVCFISDREIAGLNKTYRRKARPTDVLSFAWQGSRGQPAPAGEFENFLGEVLISASTAERNARAEGRSTRAEIRWLILHGVLHLLGYDHETDSGEMTALELALRDRLSERAARKSGWHPRRRRPRAAVSARRQARSRGPHKP